MKRLSAHFTRDENRCNCGECERYGADAELVQVLEYFRAAIRSDFKPDAVIKVNSWYRCRAHNNRPADQKNANGIYGAGSNDNSWHLSGGAVDIAVKGVKVQLLADLFRDIWPTRYGLGIYNWGLHIDVRPNPTNWDNRT